MAHTGCTFAVRFRVSRGVSGDFRVMPRLQQTRSPLPAILGTLTREHGGRPADQLRRVSRYRRCRSGRDARTQPAGGTQPRPSAPCTACTATEREVAGMPTRTHSGSARSGCGRTGRPTGPNPPLLEGEGEQHPDAQNTRGHVRPGVTCRRWPAGRADRGGRQQEPDADGEQGAEHHRQHAEQRVSRVIPPLPRSGRSPFGRGGSAWRCLHTVASRRAVRRGTPAAGMARRCPPPVPTR